jgi:hypothetical protein
MLMMSPAPPALMLDRLFHAPLPPEELAQEAPVPLPFVLQEPFT